jgi:hypothetical protein
VLCEALGLIHAALKVFYYTDVCYDAVGTHVREDGAEVRALASQLGQQAQLLARDETPLANALADVQDRLAALGALLQMTDDPKDEEETYGNHRPPARAD